ncbi:MAG: hypothetical protein ACM3KM_02195 [Acidobacteriaceae bacterium]
MGAQSGAGLPFRNHAFKALMASMKGSQGYEKIIDDLAQEATLPDIVETIALLISQTGNPCSWLRAAVEPFFRSYNSPGVEGQYALGAMLGIFQGLNELNRVGELTAIEETYSTTLSCLLKLRVGLIRQADPAVVPYSGAKYSSELSAEVKKFAGLAPFQAVRNILVTIGKQGTWSSGSKPSPVVVEIVDCMCYEIFKRLTIEQRLEAVAR